MYQLLGDTARNATDYFELCMYQILNGIQMFFAVIKAQSTTTLSMFAKLRLNRHIGAVTKNSARKSQLHENNQSQFLLPNFS